MNTASSLALKPVKWVDWPSSPSAILPPVTSKVGIEISRVNLLKGKLTILPGFFYYGNSLHIQCFQNPT